MEALEELAELEQFTPDQAGDQQIDDIEEADDDETALTEKVDDDQKDQKDEFAFE